MLGYLGRVCAIAMDTLLSAPRRRRSHLARSAPYWLRTQDDLLFEVHPGEWVDHQIATYGVAERRFLETMRWLLPSGATMIDVGANIGNHAIFLSDRCAAIHCFEPNPTAWRRLDANIAANQLTNVHVHRVGLGTRNETASFRENIGGNLGNSGFATASAVRGEGFRSVDLPIRNADDEVGRLALDRVDYIKIDVEGLEEQVIAALSATIARHRPLMSFEFHGQLADAGAFGRLTASLPDYVIAEIAESPNRGSVKARVAWLLRHAARPCLRRVAVVARRTYDNLLAIPAESPLVAQVSDR